MFSEWVVSVVGVVFFGVVADIILPQGQTSKYIKSIFAIITVFVIISPLPNLFDNFANQEDLFFEQESVELEQSLIDQLVFLKQEEMEESLKILFEENGVYNVEFEVEIDFENGKYTKDKIKIYLKNAVIQNEDKNINIKERLQKLVIDTFGVSKEMVVFYE